MASNAFPTIFGSDRVSHTTNNIPGNDSSATDQVVDQITDPATTFSQHPDVLQDFEINEPPISAMCSTCSDYKTQIVDLKKQIVQMNIDHDVKVQSMLRRIEDLQSLKMNNSSEMKEMRKHISKERERNIDLQRKIDEIKHQRYFSAEDSEIRNVGDTVNIFGIFC